MLIEIEEANINDIEELDRIEMECFVREAFPKEHIMSILGEPDSIGLLARFNGETVGFIIGYVRRSRLGETGHVITLDVVRKARRKGVGQKLLEELEKRFRRRALKSVFLEVKAGNIAASDLYRKLGYVETEQLRDYYHLGGHGVRLVKNL